jgi:hypothetical protein
MDPEELAALKAQSIREGLKRARRQAIILSLIAMACFLIVLAALPLEWWQRFAAGIGVFAVGGILNAQRQDLQEQIWQLEVELSRSTRVESDQ